MPKLTMQTACGNAWGTLNLVSVADQNSPWSISRFMRLQLAQYRESFDTGEPAMTSIDPASSLSPFQTQSIGSLKNTSLLQQPHVALLRDSLIESLAGNKWRLLHDPNIQSSILSYVDHLLSKKRSDC